MLFSNLHDWPATEAEALTLQSSLAEQVDVSQRIDPCELIAGCDIAYHLVQPILFAAVVVVRASDGRVIETRTATAAVNFPYMPGLLSFRELPALLTAFTDLRQTPEAVMFDGQGIAHPRRFGSACHLGLWLNLPCVGCAKSWLVGEYDEPGPAAGDARPLTVGDEPIGAVLRSARGAKPVYVSPGHLIDVPSSLALVLSTLSGFRQPTPTREAHLAANRMRAAHRD
jgi:deoxyribonuclease V